MDLLTLLNAIDDTYSEPELQALCTQLGVDYRILPGYAKRHKAMELVATMQRRDELPALAAMVAAERPALAAALQPLIKSLEENLTWLEGDKSSPNGRTSSVYSNGNASHSPNSGTNGHSVGAHSHGTGINGSANDVNGAAKAPALSIAPTTKGFKTTEYAPPPADDPQAEQEPDAAEPELVVGPPNPYTPGPAVTQPEMFFGRATEVSMLAEAMATGRHVLVVGPHRMGKSSLLNHAAAMPMPSSRTLCALVDLRQPRTHGGLKAAHAAWEQWWTGVRPGNAPVVDSTRVFGALVRKLQEADYRLVLMIDHLEQLVWRPRAFDPALPETLRELAADGIITLLATSRLPAAELTTAAPENRRETLTDLLRLLRPFDLSLLDADAALALASEPLGASGLAVPDDAAAHLLEIAGPHPFFLHLAGHFLFEELSQGAYDREAFDARFAAAAEPFWQQSWESLSPLAQSQFITDTTRPDSPIAARQMRILANRGLLLPEGDSYRPFSRGMGAWLGRLRSAQSVAGL